MEFLLIMLGGLFMAYLGLCVWESNTRFRLLGFIPIPKFLIAGTLILAGLSVAATGCQMMPDDFLGGKAQKLAQIFDFGSDRKGDSREQTQEVGDQYAFSSYVSGDWGEKFVRSNGHTYPFVFDAPLYQCIGFTLEYEIVEIMEGNLDGNFRYEAYVRQTDGKWKSVELFQMSGSKATLDIRLNKAMDIDAVAVVCGKRGDTSFSFTIGVRDPLYA